MKDQLLLMLRQTGDKLMAHNITIMLRRELNSYFATPIAYVFIVIFLFLSGIFTFYLGNFFGRGQADLQPFFNFQKPIL